MYAEVFETDREQMESGSYLLHGLPEVQEGYGPWRLGIEAGLPRHLYLYERVLLAAPEIAGVKFHARRGALGQLAPGGRLNLVRERANRHDRCAVGVYAPGGEKIGYVPRFAAPLVAGAIDRGKRVAARVCSVDAGTNSVVMRIYEYRPTTLNSIARIE